MLWNYLGDDGSSEMFLDAAGSSGWEFVHPPSIVLEVHRSSSDASRDARIAAMVRSRGDRLASEAELCVNELVKAARYHRPRWFRRRIDMQTVNHYHGVWTNRIWAEARADSRRIHLWQEGLERSTETGLIRSQRFNKRSMARPEFDVPYNQVRLSAPPYVSRHFGGSWNGDSTDAWRFEIGQRYWDVMIGRPGREHDTCRDFLHSYLDERIATADPHDFRRLWFDELTVKDVARDWLTCAVNYTQVKFRVQDSNVRDAQHSAYLVDADIFLSADRRLVDVLKIVREQAPFDFAEPRLVRPASCQNRFEAILSAGQD
jgi:hypothetical protein